MLLDNGRTATLADPDGRAALRCIRCSACLNVCPVYERTGGHAYGSVYPGPIGAVLSPQLTGVHDNPSLPFASTLCGACYDVCPVAIDIPTMLVHLRAKVVDDKSARTPEAVAMKALAWTMTHPRWWARALRAAKLGRVLGRRRGVIRRLPPPLSALDRFARPRPPTGRDLPRALGAGPLMSARDDILARARITAAAAPVHRLNVRIGRPAPSPSTSSNSSTGWSITGRPCIGARRQTSRRRSDRRSPDRPQSCGRPAFHPSGRADSTITPTIPS